MRVKLKFAGTRFAPLWLGALFTLAGVLPLAAEDLAQRVVVLANSRQPGSVELARFYAAQRGVPAANIVALPLPVEESITWRQFVDQVWQPLQDELYRRGWIEGTTSTLLDRFGRRRHAPTGHGLSYLVTCRGVPLRIYNDPTLLAVPARGRKIADQFNRNEAAVDSELSLLAFANHETSALLANPLFAQDGPASLDAALVIKVARLDGPGWEAARRLVTSALEAERTGLIGRYYVDLQGPHPEGDAWLASVRAQLDDLGYAGDVEESQGGFPADARFDRAAFYFGWYAGTLDGPMAREDFAFAPGAVALHIHSYSAQTLQSPTAAWCGPLVARGAAATVGNVFEPYLQLTHRPNLLFRALSLGRNLGDAAYYALPALSWQSVVIGDPLYRPFLLPLDEQLGREQEPGRAALARLRQANLLAQRGLGDEASAALRAAARFALASGDGALQAEIAARAQRLARGGEPGTARPPLMVK